jgi:hypothetical protein
VTARTLQGIDPRGATVVVNRGQPAAAAPTQGNRRAPRMVSLASDLASARVAHSLGTPPGAPADPDAALRAVTAGRPLSVPHDRALTTPSWTVRDLADETRAAFKRLALSVAGELAR